MSHEMRLKDLVLDFPYLNQSHVSHFLEECPKPWLLKLGHCAGKNASQGIGEQ